MRTVRLGALPPALAVAEAKAPHMRPAPVAGRAAISDHIDGRTALTEVQWSLLEDPAPKTDLLLVFGTYHHRTMFGEMCNTLAEATNAAHWLGTTTEAVTANDHTIEAEPGLVRDLPHSSRSVRSAPPRYRRGAVCRRTHPKAWRT